MAPFAKCIEIEINILLTLIESEFHIELLETYAGFGLSTQFLYLQLLMFFFTRIFYVQNQQLHSRFENLTVNSKQKTVQ